MLCCRCALSTGFDFNYFYRHQLETRTSTTPKNCVSESRTTLSNFARPRKRIQCRPALKNLLFQARLSSYWLPQPEHQFLFAKFLFRSPFLSRNGHSCSYFNTDCSTGGCQP
ncbi:unnamed protein product [Ectocarpus fasciculatus]